MRPKKCGRQWSSPLVQYIANDPYWTGVSVGEDVFVPPLDGVAHSQKKRIFLFTRRRRCGFAEYWKHFMARLNGVHTFGYNYAGSESIWLKFGTLRVHCLPLALADFGRDRRRSESETASQIFVFFLSRKQRAISPTSSGPKFTKFAHNTWICVVMNPFGTNFRKFPRKGSFFPKRQLFLNDFRLQAPVTP